MALNILILGGDLRQIKVGEEFQKEAHNVSFFGFDREYLNDEYKTYDNLFDALYENEIIIMGLPVTKDNMYLNTPLFSGRISLKELISSSSCDNIFIGGMLSGALTKKLKRKTEKVFDYYEREELIIKNVIPTVEGAVGIAIEETPTTIFRSNVLICGFGRLGKLAAKTFKALGANVTVSARKLSDFAWIDSLGYEHIKTGEIYRYIDKFDIIINTIPYKILENKALNNMNKESLIIDLASKPGGVDFNYAKLIGVKTIWALSLPGEVIG